MRHRSPIWKMPETEFIALVNQSTSITEVLRLFGLGNVGGNHRTLKDRMDELGLDYTRLANCSVKMSRKNLMHDRTPIELALVEHSKYSRFHLKRRLISEGVFENACQVCGLGNQWNSQPLTLVLDHINGVRDDNRLSNLRLLCPNCNSQQQTFCGRQRRQAKNCVRCGSAIGGAGKTGMCYPCAQAMRAVKTSLSYEELLVLLDEHSNREVGVMLGVSEGAIRKWVRKGYIPGSSSGRILDFESKEEGSSPSPGTTP